jgi:nitrite reductase/ring-hydroxylating ferredoxin subunit
MDLPQSVATIGEQLSATGEIAAPDAGFFDGQDVFAAEHAKIFLSPWVAADHWTRLGTDGRYFVFDAATRSIVVTRDEDGVLHAMRNLCIHAGYRVCDAEEGAAERLVCLYHGWEYALDGRLVEPNLSARIDPARLRMKQCPVQLRDGLILVDVSDKPADPPEVPDGIELPDWLGDAKVTQRRPYNIEVNWKLLRQFTWSAPELFLADHNDIVSFGPLSWLIAGAKQAALVRIVPRSPTHTDLQLIRLASEGKPILGGADHVGRGLRKFGETIAQDRENRLDRDFFEWYWPLISAAA